MKSRLRFSEDEWKELDRFFRDTVAWEEGHEIALGDMRHWIAMFNRDLLSRTAPDGFISLLDPSEISAGLLPTAIASALIASMCERLAVAEQLVYGVISAARQHNPLNAALCARSVAEVVADTHRFRSRIEGVFGDLRADGHLAADMHAQNGQMVSLLSGFRHAGRLQADRGMPPGGPTQSPKSTGSEAASARPTTSSPRCAIPTQRRLPNTGAPGTASTRAASSYRSRQPRVVARRRRSL